jgi:hypothetical protein
LFPVFLSSSTMQSPPAFQTISPIGADLRAMMTFVQASLGRGGTPYVGTATFPPLSYVLFRPLLLMQPSQRYLVVFFMTVACYAMSAFWFPLSVSGEKQVRPELLLVFGTGLISYGLQFELERGQFHVIAMFLAFLAIWLYHSRKGQEIWAFVLFSLSVQLKLYPIVFIVMFVRDWRDFKKDVGRLALLVLGNVVLFFVLGWRGFLEFVNTLMQLRVRMPTAVSVDHSIYSFVGLAARNVAAGGSPWSAAHTALLEIELLAIVALCLMLMVLQSWRGHSTGVNAQLLAGCAVASLLIPAASGDYKLATLAGPVGLLLVDLRRRDKLRSNRIRLGLATLLFCLAYSSILVPLSFKPRAFVFQNNLPALLVMIVADAFIALWLSPPSEGEVDLPPSRTGGAASPAVHPGALRA